MYNTNRVGGGGARYEWSDEGRKGGRKGGRKEGREGGTKEEETVTIGGVTGVIDPLSATEPQPWRSTVSTGPRDRSPNSHTRVGPLSKLISLNWNTRDIRVTSYDLL